MRAPVTRLILPDRLSQRQTMVLGIVLLLLAVGVAYSAAVGQRVWNARPEQQAATQSRVSNEGRAASQYAHVKMPLKGDKCTTYSFDNKAGAIVNEREALCDQAALPKRATPVDGASRLQGISNAFKKQQ